MGVSDGVYTALTGDATIGGLIGTRCYPVRLPDAQTLPAIAYTSIDDVPDASGGLMLSRVQIDCYAETFAGLKTLAAAVQAEIDAQKWELVGWDAEVYDEVGASKYYVQSVDVKVMHEV